MISIERRVASGRGATRARLAAGCALALALAVSTGASAATFFTSAHAASGTAVWFAPTSSSDHTTQGVSAASQSASSSDTIPAATMMATSSAAAQVQGGAVKMRAEASAASSAYQFVVAGAGASAQAEGILNDTFVVACPGCIARQTGQMTFGYYIDGSLYGWGETVTTGVGPVLGGWYTYEDFTARIGLNGDYWQHGQAAALDDQGNVVKQPDATGFFQVTIPVVFGASNSLYMRGYASTEARTGAQVLGGGGGFSVTGIGLTKSDFSHTLGWGGITELRDASGALMTGFTAKSDLTGFDYAGRFSDVTGGVPEPAAWALMILGFGATGAAMRRRSRAGGRSAAA